MMEEYCYYKNKEFTIINGKIDSFRFKIIDGIDGIFEKGHGYCYRKNVRHFATTLQKIIIRDMILFIWKGKILK